MSTTIADSAFLVSDGEVERREPVASAPLSVSSPTNLAEFVRGPAWLLIPHGQSYNLPRTITARPYGGPIVAHLHHRGPAESGLTYSPFVIDAAAADPPFTAWGVATSPMYTSPVFASERWTRHEQARSSSAPGWLPPTLKRLRDLLRLPSDWDGYGAAETRLDDAVDALIFLRRVMLASTPLPAIVPLNDGGVQLEWHESGLDFEATFTGGADRGFYLHDHHTREDAEGSIEKGIAELRRHMDRF